MLALKVVKNVLLTTMTKLVYAVSGARQYWFITLFMNTNELHLRSTKLICQLSFCLRQQLINLNLLFLELLPYRSTERTCRTSIGKLHAIDQNI